MGTRERDDEPDDDPVPQDRDGLLPSRALLGTLLAVPVTRDLLYKAPGAQWRLAHTHLNLAGFVIMFIFGIAYHVLPRFAESRCTASVGLRALLGRYARHGGDGYRVHRSPRPPFSSGPGAWRSSFGSFSGRQPMAHDPVMPAGRKRKGGGPCLTH